MRRTAAVLAILAGAGLASVPALAYSHFIHYLNGVAVPEKFDLASLPDKTVTFFVSQNGPVNYSTTDTFNSVVSQLRQATGVWNAVATSDLRVAFGGLENTATLQNTPGGDIVFEDLPPGLLGYGGPSSLAAPVTTGSAPFVPIKRAAVHLNRNLRLAPGPSYNETFFMTAVHEMGHALGLQHTFTSSTMSTATTRATTLSRPIDADDEAALSILYPNAGFAKLGSVSGRITAGTAGVHMASVVAIRSGGGAVSALTGPDGSYRIDGIPAGQYFVYAHPLPPDADIFGPWNADGSVASRSGATNALFYPGTTNLADATPISVESGKQAAGVSINLASRPFVAIYDAGVYGYFNNNSVAVKPAYVNMLNGAATVVASGAGLGANGQAPGLTVQFLGNSARVADGGVRPYQANGFTYIALDLGFNLFAGNGPQHLVFSTPTFMHVLPAGVILTRQSPPTVASVTANGDGTVAVTGTNWSADSLIYFDGLPAVIQSLDAKGSAVVTPPVGANGQRAIVTVYNRDGQNSQMVQGSAPVTYSYGVAPTPTVVSVSPASLPAGSEAAVEIVTSGMTLTPGQTVVGFGTSDVLVRRVFVMGPNRLLVNVSVAAGAALSNPDISVMSGFQMTSAIAGFQIAPAEPTAVNAVPVFTNTARGLNGLYPGATVAFAVNGLPPAVTPTVLIGGQPATVTQVAGNVVTLQLPAGLSAGPAILNLSAAGIPAQPVVMAVDTTPAQITQVQSASGAVIDQAHPARTNDVLNINLTGLLVGAASLDPNRVQVAVGDVMHSVIAATSLGFGTWQVTVVLNGTVPTGAAQPVIVYLDGRSSYPVNIALTRPDGSLDPVNTLVE